MPEDKTNNKQVFFNIDILDEAIHSKKKVSFKYLDYGTDKKQHKKCKEDGTERVYIVSPYQMAAKEGKYYLICNYDKYDDYYEKIFHPDGVHHALHVILSGTESNCCRA